MANAAIGIFKVILGLIFVLIGILGILRWWNQLIEIIKGSVGIAILLAGFLLILLGFSDFRD
ncbi:hypothetical protein J4231_01470 [Candidatus Woesearchaeota archaeon]|nr:hypothetical protein [Candidatus Woesearchaeota archaeon]